MNYDRVILELIDRMSKLEDEVSTLKTVLATKRQDESNESAIAENDNEDYSFLTRSGRDTTKYLLDGKAYPKNRLVLAVVQKYIKENPNLSAEDLMNVFDKSLQGSLGVIREIEDIKRTYQDPANRFFMTTNALIHTTTDTCAVCTQWGVGNIGKLIARARQLGMEIEEV